MVGPHGPFPRGEHRRVHLVRVEVPPQLAEDVRHFLPGAERFGVLGAEDTLTAVGDAAVLTQGVGGAAGAAEREGDLVAAGECVGVVRAEGVLALRRDGAVNLARLLPAAEPAEAQARVVPGGEVGDHLRRGRGAFRAHGLLTAPRLGARDPLSGKPRSHVGRRAAQDGRAYRLVAGRHAARPGRQPRLTGHRRARLDRGLAYGGCRHRRHVSGGGTAVSDPAGHFAGVPRPLVRLLREQVKDDPVQEAGEPGPVRAGWFGQGVAVPDEDGPGVLQVEGWRSGRDLVEHAAERVQVAAPVDVFAADLLGRHVVRGAHRDAGAGETSREPDVVAEARDAEVADLHRAVGEPHDVRGLQVAVDDALFMRVGERGRDLVGDLDDVRDG